MMYQHLLAFASFSFLTSFRRFVFWFLFFLLFFFIFILGLILSLVLFFIFVLVFVFSTLFLFVTFGLFCFFASSLCGRFCCRSIFLRIFFSLLFFIFLLSSTLRIAKCGSIKFPFFISSLEATMTKFRSRINPFKRNFFGCVATRLCEKRFSQGNNSFFWNLVHNLSP